jgi:cell division protein FtsA
LAGPEPLLGLDIGTTKVAAVVGGGPAGRLRGAASVACKGLKRGVVVDVGETTRAIEEAVRRAQQMAAVELGSAWVGITGQHISCINSHAEIQLARASREIEWDDVERVIAAAAHAISIAPDRQLIHAVSRGFQVDNEPRVKNPVGLSASRLGVEAHIVTASRNRVENVTKCVEGAGLEVEELVAEPLATADAVLTEEEEKLGVLLLDVGGGTTDMGVFLEGVITFTGAVPLGGDHVTHDVAVALGITHPRAEEMKLAHGRARAALVPEEENIVLSDDEAPERRTVSRRFLAEVIEARVRETFRLASQEVGRLGGQGMPPGGAVLTGGGSLLPGIASVAQEMLGCRARLGRPRITQGPADLVESPALATGVGLVYYALREAEARRSRPARRVRILPVLGRFMAWVRERFAS